GAAFAANGKAYFTDSGLGQKLWESDGTPQGTRVLRDLVPGWESCPNIHTCYSQMPFDITPAGDKIFFVAGDPATHETALWTYEPATGAFREIVDVPPGTWLTAMDDGRVAFTALTGEPLGYQVWVSDGTTAGTAPFF